MIDSKNAKHTLSIVILNFRTPKQTLQTLKLAAAACDRISVELIVVDNASRDDSVEYIHENMPNVRVIEMPSNLGFAAGMNAGIRKSMGDYVLLLNSDIEAREDSIKVMLNFMENNPNAGLIAPLLTDTNGKASRTLLIQPTFWRVVIPMVGKMRYKQWRKRIGTEPLMVEATEGASIMVSRKVLDKAGVLDEDFFFYHEIVEWCMRIRDNGFDVMVVPSAKMIHACGGSTGKVRKAAKIELKRSEYQLLHKRMGSFIYRFALTRDLLSGILRTLFYSLGVILTAGKWTRGRQKLLVSYAVVKWLLVGMPDRHDDVYVSMFGAWD